MGNCVERTTSFFSGGAIYKKDDAIRGKIRYTIAKFYYYHIISKVKEELKISDSEVLPDKTKYRDNVFIQRNDEKNNITLSVDKLPDYEKDLKDAETKFEKLLVGLDQLKDVEVPWWHHLDKENKEHPLPAKDSIKIEAAYTVNQAGSEVPSVPLKVSLNGTEYQLELQKDSKNAGTLKPVKASETTQNIPLKRSKVKASTQEKDLHKTA